MTYIVYLLRSAKYKSETYIGITRDINKRLSQHNSGQSSHTKKYMPWEIIAYFTFYNKDKAYDFEKYLKSHSGRAFANKRFW